MRDDYTHITLVVDRSGSMSAIQESAQRGINDFVREHKKAPGMATFLFTDFDDQHNTVYEGDIGDFGKYTLEPRNSTAMLDAVGRAIVRTGQFLSAMPEDQRPAGVIFAVVTDGQENASVEYTWDRIREMIREQRDTYNWQFVFLATNIDAHKVGRDMGVANNSQFQPTAKSMQGTYSAFTTNSVNYRGAVAAAGGQSVTMDEMPDVDEQGNPVERKEKKEVSNS